MRKHAACLIFSKHENILIEHEHESVKYWNENEYKYLLQWNWNERKWLLNWTYMTKWNECVKGKTRPSVWLSRWDDSLSVSKSATSQQGPGH